MISLSFIPVLFSLLDRLPSLILSWPGALACAFELDLLRSRTEGPNTFLRSCTEEGARRRDRPFSTLISSGEDDDT